MLVKISIIIYLIAAVLHFINGQMALLGISVLLGIITFGISAYISYLRVSPQLREYRETVYKMEADGVSDEEISELLDQETEVDESKLLDQETEVDESKLPDAPLWMNIVVILGVVASFILFGIGVIKLTK